MNKPKEFMLWGWVSANYYTLTAKYLDENKEAWHKWLREEYENHLQEKDINQGDSS